MGWWRFHDDDLHWYTWTWMFARWCANCNPWSPTSVSRGVQIADTDGGKQQVLTIPGVYQT
jgi:hypothetical protein